MKLYEVLSKDDLDTLRVEGYKKIDSVTLDGYSLYLFKIHKTLVDDGIELKYELALQRGDLSFTKPTDQEKKILTTPLPNSIKTLKSFREVVTKWIDQYGAIIVASYLERNTKIYARMFSSVGLKVKSFNYPDTFAFYLTKED